MVFAFNRDSGHDTRFRDMITVLSDYYGDLLTKQRALDDDLYNPQSNDEEVEIMLTQYNTDVFIEEQWAVCRRVEFIEVDETQLYNLGNHDGVYKYCTCVLFKPTEFDKLPALVRNTIKKRGK